LNENIDILNLDQFARTELCLNDQFWSPFGTIAFLRSVEEASGKEIKFPSFLADDGSIKASIALFSRSDYQGFTLAPFCPYNPIWVDSTEEELRQSLVSSTLDYLGQFDGHHHLHLAPQYYSTKIDSGSSSRRELSTYHIDLSKDWRRAYSKSLARIVRKNADESIVEQDNEQLEQVCRLVGQGYSRNERNMPLGEDQLQVYASRQIELGLARVFVIRDEQKNLRSGVVILHNDDIAYYWLAGGEKGPWMTVLIDTVLEILSNRGISTFDFLGANNPSIAEFKRRFGGQLIPYLGAECVVGAKAKAKQSLKKILRR